MSHGAFMESIFETAIRMNLSIMGKPQFDEIFRSPMAPLSSLSSKVIMARALGLIGEEMRSQADQIRRIRNAFAHAIRVIDFSNPTIAAESAKLDAARMVRPDLTFVDHRKDPKGRFLDAAELIEGHLLEFISYARAGLQDGSRSLPKPYRSKFA
jgi:hypothetical protein